VKLLRRLAAILGGLAVLYVLMVVALYAAMVQPPERFGAFMSYVPMPAMMILPFRPLWMSARTGHLAPGDPAPDFALPTTDHTSTVRLSSELRDRPVALVFGSYT